MVLPPYHAWYQRNLLLAHHAQGPHPSKPLLSHHSSVAHAGTHSHLPRILHDHASTVIPRRFHLKHRIFHQR